MCLLLRDKNDVTEQMLIEMNLEGKREEFMIEALAPFEAFIKEFLDRDDIKCHGEKVEMDIE